MSKIVVVGAGIGGLSTAALLAKAGLDVTVLESHVYPGGCAGTFYYQGYRFDAGATLAGGFNPNGPLDRLGTELGINWPSRPTDPAMLVHLSNGEAIARYSDDRRWDERQHHFGKESLEFWQWQEQAADAMWALAEQNPLWPPQRPGELIKLADKSLKWAAEDIRGRLSPALIRDAFSSLNSRVQQLSPRLRHFLDGQLLISAQTTSSQANALYAAAALDLPRRGVRHLDGGMGTIAEELVKALERFGGNIHYRQAVNKVIELNGKPVGVETDSGEAFYADQVIFNLPPWNIRRILGNSAPRKLRALPPKPKSGWGAFVVYLGIPEELNNPGDHLHHQILSDARLDEGGSIFISISPKDDLNRAPIGARALTISTHTNLSSWWELHDHDQEGYKNQKQAFTDRILEMAEGVIPGLRDSAEVTLPGTPVTFQRFTRRDWGWVGGFPQTNLFQSWGPRIKRGIWMVGDSIFPGQSTAAVALGGMRVSDQVIAETGAARPKPIIRWEEASGPVAYQRVQSSRKTRN